MHNIFRSIGPSYDLIGLEYVIAQLLKRGFADGFVSIQARKSTKYLELTKYIVAEGNYGLRLHVPLEPWSEAYFGMIQAYCSEEKIEFSLESEDSEDEIITLCVDFQKDAPKAYDLVKVIFTRFFRVPESNKFCVVLRNCSASDELIEGPHQKEMSWAESMRQMDAETQRRIGVSLGEFFLSMLLGNAQILGVLSLGYSLAFAKKTWTWSNIEVAGISINAPIFGLFWCGFILLCSLRVINRTYWIKFRNNQKLDQEHRSKKWRHKYKAVYIIFNYVNIVSIVLLLVAGSAWVTITS